MYVISIAIRRIGFACLIAAHGIPASCSPRLSDSLPPFLADKVEVLPAGHSDWRVELSMVMSGAGRRGFVTVPIRVENNRLFVSNLIAESGRDQLRTFDVEAVLDTGATGPLLLSTAAARTMQPWLSGQVGTRNAIGAIRPHDYWTGVLGGIRLAELTIRPIPVHVGAISSPVILGMGVLALFDGIIFDWPQSQMYVLMRQYAYQPELRPSLTHFEALARRPEWTSIPLLTSTFRQQTESSPRTIDFRALPPCIEVRVGSGSYRAIIDTGGQGDVLLREGINWPFVPGGRRHTVIDVSKARISVKHRALRVPLRIGECEFENVIVSTGWVPPSSLPDMPIDAVLGLGVLNRAPMWIDFTAGVVRFWMGDEPLPSPAVPAGDAE